MASPPSTPPLLPGATVFHATSSPATPGTPITPSAPSPVEGPGSSECVVCMEAAVFVLLRLAYCYSVSKDHLDSLSIVSLSRLRSSFCPVVTCAAVRCAAMLCRDVLFVAATYCSAFVFTTTRNRGNNTVLILHSVCLCILH